MNLIQIDSKKIALMQIIKNLILNLNKCVQKMTDLYYNYYGYV